MGSSPFIRTSGKLPPSIIGWRHQRSEPYHTTVGFGFIFINCTNQKGDDLRSSPFWFDVILKTRNPLLLLATATICARAGYKIIHPNEARKYGFVSCDSRLGISIIFSSKGILWSGDFRFIMHKNEFLKL